MAESGRNRRESASLRRGLDRVLVLPATALLDMARVFDKIKVLC
jgi:hypothetical protein